MRRSQSKNAFVGETWLVPANRRCEMRLTAVSLCVLLFWTCKPAGQDASVASGVQDVQSAGPGDFAEDSEALDQAVAQLLQVEAQLAAIAKGQNQAALTGDDEALAPDNEDGSGAMTGEASLQLTGQGASGSVADLGPLDPGDGGQMMADPAYQNIFSHFDLEASPESASPASGLSLQDASAASSVWSAGPMSVDDLSASELDASTWSMAWVKNLSLFEDSKSAPEALALTRDEGASFSLADCMPRASSVPIDQSYRKRAREVMATQKRAVATMAKIRAEIQRAPSSQVAQNLGKMLKVAQNTATVATQQFGKMMRLMTFAAGRIAPVAGAATMIAGIAVGIAEAVNIKQSGGSDAAAAAEVLSGMGLAGAIPAVIACGDCSPAEKAAAFFKGFFGIDFTERANCRAGFEPIGCCICRKIGCDSYYDDLAATCHRGIRTKNSVYTGANCYGDICGLTTGKGCRKCPNDAKDWVFRGCYCELPPHSYSKETYSP